jgi:putative phage-type endonuclease
MEIITGIEQGSDEWLALRYGWITASRFKDAKAGGQGKTRKSYMYQLAGEAVTDLRGESFTNEYMEWGTETEPQARAMYELNTGNLVEEVTFIKLDEQSKIGCSPDGIIGDDGMIEIKCPKTSTQIETFLSGKIPTGHLPQVQGQLWVSGRQWCDFVSFDPRINGEASYLCVRVERDDEYIKTLSEACYKFSGELKEMINTLIGEK